MRHLGIFLRETGSSPTVRSDLGCHISLAYEDEAVLQISWLTVNFYSRNSELIDLSKVGGRLVTFLSHQ